jgi:prophage regulatory protein
MIHQPRARAREGKAMLEKHEKLLRLTDVQRRVPFSRSMIYLKISRGEFPQPIKLGASAVAWLESEVDFWIETRIKNGRTETGVSGRL